MPLIVLVIRVARKKVHYLRFILDRAGTNKRHTQCYLNPGSSLGSMVYGPVSQFNVSSDPRNKMTAVMPDAAENR